MARTRIVFWGSPGIAAQFLEHLYRNYSAEFEITACVTQTEKLVQRQGKAAVRSAVHERATMLGIPVFTPKSVKKEADELLYELQALGFDLFVVLAYGKILPVSIIEAPRLKSVNFHGSLLPLLRGASPIEHSLLHGFTETGWTLQRIVERLDAGDVIAQCSFPIAHDETTGTLYVKMTGSLIEHGARMLTQYVTGAAQIHAQDESAATHCGKISAEDGKLDFTRPAMEIRNRYRAFTPRPGVYALFRGKKIKLAFDLSRLPLTPSPTDKEGENQQQTLPAGLLAGSLFSPAKGQLAVTCGDGSALAISAITPEGKKAMPAADFINGYRLTDSEILH